MIRFSAPRLFVLAVALVATAVASARVTEKITRTFPLTADGSVAISNVNGAIEIVGWDRNDVSLEAEKSAASDDALKRIQITIDDSPQRLVIKTEHEKRWKFWDNARAKVTYKLRVPAGASLRKIDVVNASIRVSGVTGYADLESVNGSIKADGLASGGRFHTVNGSITAAFTALRGEGKISLNSVNGTCSVELPANAAFELKAGSTNGRISCDFPITLSKSGRGTLSGTVNGGGALVTLHSVNGTLRVRAASQ